MHLITSLTCVLSLENEIITIHFAACEILHCVSIPVINDQSFTLTLGRTLELDNRITLSPVNATIIVNGSDHDGML